MAFARGDAPLAMLSLTNMRARLLLVLSLPLYACGGKGSPVASEAGAAPAADAAPSSTAVWPMYRHDLAHTGRSPHLGPSAPRVRWQWNPGSATGSGLSSGCPPVIAADGTLYVPVSMGGNNSLYALSNEGAERWHTAVSHRCAGSAAIANDGTVYLASGNLVAIGPDGALRWTFIAPDAGQLSGSPAVGPDGTIYVATEGSGLYALTPDGTAKWHFPTGEGNKSSPALASDGTVYLGGDEKLYAVSPAGAKKWEAPLEASEHLSPMIDDQNRVAAIRHDLLLFSPEGSLVATIATDAIWSQYPAALAPDGSWVIGSQSGLKSFGNDGQAAWKIDPQVLSGPSVPVIDAEGTIYLVDHLGVVQAYDEQGQLRWSFDSKLGAGGGSPVLGADRTLYLVNESFGIAAIGD